MSDFNLEEHTAISVSTRRRTISRLQYDGYKGHDPAERRGFLQGILALQNELIDFRTGEPKSEVSGNA